MEPRLLLVHYIRECAELHGTHWGCDTSNCGICVVLMDGEPIKSCTTLAAMAEGHEITTVEGLEKNGVLDPIQQGFHEMHALQCGFCTPGMMVTGRRAHRQAPEPHPDDRLRDPRSDLGRPVSLHRLREHRQGDQVGCRVRSGRRDPEVGTDGY